PSWRVATTPQDWRSLAGDLETDTNLPQTQALPATGDWAESEKPTFQTEMGRISGQSGVVFAGTIFTAVLGYAFKVYLARSLGAEALGIYALGMTIISLLGILGVLGLPNSAVRFVALYAAS